MVDWKFYIDSPLVSALYLCKGSLDRGCGKGVGRYGYVDGDGESDGNELGYGNCYGDGWGDGFGYGAYDDDGDGESAEKW